MKTVLIADDEKSSSEIIRYFIEAYHLPLEVIGEAGRGDVVLQQILLLRPDLVFMDIEMPVMNGLEIMAEIKKEVHLNTSFVVITAYNYFEYAQQALRLGAKDLLLKPVQYGQFCETMGRVVGYRYSTNPLFNQILEYIHEHYTEELALSDCAEALSATPTHISRLLKKHMDISFTVYCNKLRIEKALSLLDEGCAIKEAAQRSGYQNINYFYRRFKEQVGVTPGEYLEHHLNGES